MKVELMIHENIPEGWKTERLEHMCTKLKSGGTPSVSNPKYYNGNISFVKIEDMTKNGKYIENTKTNITEEGLKNSSAWLIPKNSILFSIYASVGEVAITKRELATNQAIMGICPDSDKIDTRYLYEYLRYIKPSLSKYFKTTTQKNLTAAIAKDLEISHPVSLQEQKKIAAILTTIDENIEETDKIIAECERVKKGLMQALLTKGIPGRHKKFKETELGVVPEEWDILSLGEAAQFVNGRAFKPSDWTTDGIPIVRIQNLNGGEDYNYYLGEYEEKNIVRKGDLLFSWSGSRGTSFGPFIVQIEKGILNQHIFRVVPSSRVEMSFLYYFLKYLTYKIEGRAHGGAGLVHIKKSEIEKFKMVVPTIPEQREIAETLSTFERRLEGEKARATQLAILKHALMQKLLSGKIRVKAN